MAPAARAASNLSRKISDSNALNRAIQIDLISEDDYDDEEGKEKKGEFFRKRTKTFSDLKKFNGVRLKNISSSDPPPFPKDFQLTKSSFQPVNFEFTNRFASIEPILKGVNKDSSAKLKEGLAKVIRETYSEIDFKTLNGLFSVNFEIPSVSKKIKTIFNEIEVNLSSGQPILFLFTGLNGVGKTKLVESLTESLNLRLITIDSTQIPRNAKTFETLQTTLSHSNSEAKGNFFSKSSCHVKRQKTAILFDEVEIAFETDRGYWSALSSFLNSSVARSVPIFITSNADISFIQSIIKLPDHFRFSEIVNVDCRKINVNNDFIRRLHRIDTSIEYEHFAMMTGYYYTERDLEMISDMPNASIGLITEALRWGHLIDEFKCELIDEFKDESNPFSYAESASFSDLLLTVKEDDRTKMNLDIRDNISCEFFDDDYDNSTLLYSSIPEIYETSIPILKDIASECLGMTIKSFTDQIKCQGSTSTSIQTRDTSQNWKDLGKKLSRRFFDYTKSLQFHQTWSQEIASHVIFLESDNHQASVQSRRRRRAFYRYLGDELLNEILDLKGF